MMRGNILADMLKYHLEEVPADLPVDNGRNAAQELDDFVQALAVYGVPPQRIGLRNE